MIRGTDSKNGNPWERSTCCQDKFCRTGGTLDMLNHMGGILVDLSFLLESMEAGPGNASF